MKVEIFHTTVLITPLHPKDWPGLHKIPESAIVNADGESVIEAQRSDYAFGTVDQCGEKVQNLKKGDKVFWQRHNGQNLPVLEDWIVMTEGQIIGFWEEDAE